MDLISVYFNTNKLVLTGISIFKVRACFTILFSLKANFFIKRKRIMKSCTSGRRNKFYLECLVAATTLNHDATLEYKVFNFSFFKKIKNKNLSTLIKSYLQKKQ